MSRKDYTLIAAALNRAWHQADDGAERYGVIVSVNSIMDTLAAENARFNRDTFRDAVYA